MKDAKGHGSDPRGAHASGIADQVPALQGQEAIINSPDLMHRGMSEVEYEAILKSGGIHSSGIGNVGEGERGMTFFTTDPRVALSYAQVNGSTDKTPAYIVSIARRPGTINRENGFEIGIPGSVKATDIRGAYRGQKVEGKWRWEKLK